ncbi:hypothetical protein LCGC14_2459430 [marine sediment metagenome]|uniref:Uncharacterized protein n=1 Tax=marine sediment metagenome TaxID=412755 RepID=A0A0F9DQW4_9ZZZZ
MSQSVCEKACFILTKTNDGDDLSPQHLYLLQEMVNGHLTKWGEQEFEKLYLSAQAGYVKPWFHGIEHMTVDHIGYVLWKGRVVEHYDSPWRWTQEAKAQAEEVARRCRHLESIEVVPSTKNIIWTWPD